MPARPLLASPGLLPLLNKRLPPSLRQFANNILMGLYHHLRSISDDRGGNQSNLNSQIVGELQIPLPDLTVQKQIVSKLQEEQKLVEASKKLIEIFEQKIKDKIAEVWGE